MSSALSESRNFTPPHRPNTSKDAPKVRARYKDDSTNCKIISSDNVIFYVKRCELETGSRVFADMLQFSGPSSSDPVEIPLTDENMEPAEVLAILLDIWHGEPCPSPLTDAAMRRLAEVAKLAVKYDCPAATCTMSRTFRACLIDGVSPRRCFVLLACLDDLLGWAAAIQRAGKWSWSARSGEADMSLRGTIVGATIFDVASWDTEFYTAAPQAYSFALLVTARNVRVPLVGNTDWNVVAGEFTRVMKADE